MASAQQLLKAFDGLLQPERFKDYGPNGLQVEGKDDVRRIVSGVTASRALIEAAVQARGRRHLRAPRPVLARPGWPGDRLDEAAAGAAARARHQSVRLPPAAGRASRAGQQRAARAQAGPGRRARRFGEQDLGFLGRRADGGSFAKRRRSWPRMSRRPWAGASPWSRERQRADRQHRLVHRRRPGLFRVGDRRRRRCLHHGRDFRAAGPLRARMRRRLPGLRPPRQRALWRSGGGRPCGAAAGHGAQFIDIDNPA